MIDTLFILSAFELGLPDSEEEATRQAMAFNAESDRRYLGEIEKNIPGLSEMIEEKNGIDASLVARTISSFIGPVAYGGNTLTTAHAQVDQLVSRYERAWAHIKNEPQPVETPIPTDSYVIISNSDPNDQQCTSSPKPPSDKSCGEEEARPS